MKSKRLFQILVLLTLLLSPFGTGRPVHASTSSPDRPMSIQRNSPAPQDTDQLPPFLYTAVDPSSMDVGETAIAAVVLNDVPAAGYTSVELTCSYDPSLLETSDIIVGDLFGVDPVIAVNGPQDGYFIVAITGSHGNKVTSDGLVMTFNVRGLQAGQTALNCKARASRGDNQLINIYSLPAPITLFGNPLTPTVVPAVCDKADFLADISIPPGTVMSPGATFTKTWRLANVGSCTWTGSYQLVFFSGEQMDGPLSADFSVSIEPGEIVDISLDMTAPSVPGSYRGYWMFRNANGALFGVGPQGDQPWFVDIAVFDTTLTPTQTPASDTATLTQTPGGSTPSPTLSATPGEPTETPIAGIAYDFAVNACSAKWYSGAGQLPCPGSDGDARGFVLKLDHPRLETGAIDPYPGLLTFPQNTQNGYIQGFYPPFHVQNGDRFRSTIGCEGGATSCYVAFRLDYQIGTDNIRTFWGPWLERYEGRPFLVDVDLSSLAGKDVKFILTVLSAGVATGDRALWARPILYRTNPIGTPSSPTPVESPTPTASATPTAVSDWLQYINTKYWFEFLYPRGSYDATIQTANYARINLPFVPGTNLGEKSLEVIVAENVSFCRSPLATSSILETSETVAINGIPFLKETGRDGTAGHINKWTAYTTSRDNACVILNFLLRASNPGVSATPPPLYDEAAESRVFGQIVSTYAWLPPPTATPGEQPSPTVTSTPSLSKYVHVASPNGGEILTVGSTYRITWDSTPDIDKILIGYKACDSCLDWIAFNIPNTGYYDWNVSVGNTINTQFKIYIIGYDTDIPGSASDESDNNITVLQPTPTLPTIVPGFLAGRVHANKPVTVGLYFGDALVTSVATNPDGTFSLTAPTGEYTVRATASGFLSAQGSAMITGGNTATKITISLPAGDINSDNVIDQFDALTIGMSYNMTFPSAADLTNDGIINVLDLELLAKNYRQTGPIPWQ